MTELWPSRSETAGSSIPAANGCDPCECRNGCRMAPFGFGILRRLNSADTEEDIEFGFNGAPSGSAKIKSSSELYVGPNCSRKAFCAARWTSSALTAYQTNRSARTSPRRVPVAADSSRNAGRHQQPVAESISNFC